MQRTEAKFGRLLTAVVSSNLGDGLVIVAFPLLVAEITRNPMAVAGLAAASGVPWLLVAPFSGALVDRADRKVVMWVVDLGRMVVMGSLAVFLMFGVESLALLYSVVFLITAGETVVDTAAQSLLPAVVEHGRLDGANARLFATQTVVHRFVGPPLGGFLFGIAATLPFLADAATFLVAAVVIAGLSGTFRPKGSDRTNQVSLWSATKAGIRWLFSHKQIRTFALGAAALNTGTVASESILVLFAQDQLGLSSVGFGLLIAMTAVGYIVGSSLAPRLVGSVDRRVAVVSAVLMVSAALFTVGSTAVPAIAGIGFAVSGGAIGVWDVVAVSYRQSIVPDALLGRIMAGYRVIAYGAFALGAAVGGVAASIAGNRAAFYVGAVVVAGLAPWIWTQLRGAELDPVRIQRS